MVKRKTSGADQACNTSAAKSKRCCAGGVKGSTHRKARQTKKRRGSTADRDGMTNILTILMIRFLLVIVIVSIIVMVSIIVIVIPVGQPLTGRPGIPRREGGALQTKIGWVIISISIIQHLRSEEQALLRRRRQREHPQGGQAEQEEKGEHCRQR